MAKTRLDYLDDRLMRLLDGRTLEDKMGLTLELVSISPAGHPHAVLLSVGEIVALGADRVRLAIWETSRTSANLRKHPNALVTLVTAGCFYGMDLAVRPCEEDLDLAGLAVFDADVAAVEREEVSYARLESGITFTLPEPELVLARWAATAEILRGYD